MIHMNEGSCKYGRKIQPSICEWAYIFLSEGKTFAK